MTKRIELTQGKFAFVDDEDFDRVNQFNWCAIQNRGNWYAHRRVTTNRGRGMIQSLHRAILTVPDGMVIDHIDGDGLNCTKENLRICSPQENAQNKRKPSTNTSGYKGVTRARGTHHRWKAQIKVNQKEIHIGSFPDVISAARAYNAAATKYFGEYARLNIITEETLLTDEGA
jgi:hypothetical protein